MRWSTATWAVALGGAALLCAACSRGPQLPADLPTDVPYAYHLQTVAGGDGAELVGTLEMLDGCLVVIPEGGGIVQPADPVVPILPIAVVDWDATTLEVNGERAAVGDRISLGGGYSTTRADADFVPAGCPPASDENTFFVGIF